MILNTVQSLFHRESSDTAFILASGSLGLVFSDGTTTAPSVTVDNSSPAKFHDLTSDTLTFGLPGPVKATWSSLIGSETFKRVETYFVSFYDIQSWVREHLRQSITQLPDEEIDNLCVQLVDDLEESYPTCFPYRSLAGQDQYWCDRGLAYTVAAYLLAQQPGRFLGNAITSIRDAQIRYQFAANPNKQAMSRAEELLGMGWVEIQRISCVAKLNTASPSLLYAVAGTRRGTYPFTPDLTGNEHIPLSVGLIRTRVLI